MKHENFPYLTIDEKLSRENIFEVLDNYAVFSSEFMTTEISHMLSGDYLLNGQIQILPNLITSYHAMEHLMYLQAFMIFDFHSDYFTDRENLESYEIRYTLEGEGILEYRDKIYSIKKGEGYFISCKEHHRYYSNNCDWKSTVMHINGKFLAEIFSAFSNTGNVKFTEESFPSFRMLQDQILSATQKISPYQEYRISCLIDILVTELLASCTPKNGVQKDSNAEIVAVFIEHLNIHYMEEINLDILCKQYGVSRTVLFEQFKRFTGFTPGQYLMQIRINKAKLLLRGSRKSIEYISAQCGFHDAGYFSQIFKKCTGITPLKYRKFA